MIDRNSFEPLYSQICRDIEQQIKRLKDLKDVLVNNKLDYRLEDDEI